MYDLVICPASALLIDSGAGPRKAAEKRREPMFREFGEQVRRWKAVGL